MGAKAEHGGLVPLPKWLNVGQTFVLSDPLQEYNVVKDEYPLLLHALTADVPEPRVIESLLDSGADTNFNIFRISAPTLARRGNSMDCSSHKIDNAI